MIGFKNRQHKLLIWATSLITFTCSGPQTDKAGTKVLNTSVAETVDSSVASKLSIDGGELKGTEVNLPAGAVPTGSKLAIVKAEKPNIFPDASTAPAASQPTAITASDSNGAAINELSSPMSINLPISKTALALADRTDANLCVLLEASEGVNYVWRRAAIAVVSGKAVFDSQRFGIFQLVYCGSDAIADFSDASSSDIAGSGSVALATLTIPGSGSFAYDFGQTHVCTAVTIGSTIVAISDHILTAGVEKEIKIYKMKESEIPAEATTAKIHLLYQGADHLCDATILTAETTVAFAELIFNRPSTALTDSSLVGILGDTTASFGLDSITVQMGREDGTNAPAPVAGSICLQTNVTGPNGGIVKVSTSLSATNLLGGNSNITIPAIHDQAATERRLDVFNQSSLCEKSDFGTQAITSPTQVTHTRLKTFSVDETVYLLPMNIALAGIGELGHAVLKRICLRLFETDPGSDEPTKQSLVLTSTLMDTKETATFQVLLPYLNKGVYTIGVKALTGLDQDCKADVNETLNNPSEISDSFDLEPADYTDIEIPTAPDTSDITDTLPI